tara:strand:+ start:81 stop:296 length:216 start_codon:yes stop_codon:yes gene_type:complete
MQRIYRELPLKIIVNMMELIAQLSLLDQKMGKERNYDNDGLDPSEEYFKKKEKANDDDTYFPPEESEPPHY